MEAADRRPVASPSPRMAVAVETGMALVGADTHLNQRPGQGYKPLPWLEPWKQVNMVTNVAELVLGVEGVLQASWADLGVESQATAASETSVACGVGEAAVVHGDVTFYDRTTEPQSSAAEMKI